MPLKNLRSISFLSRISLGISLLMGFPTEKLRLIISGFRIFDYLIIALYRSPNDAS
jgi:hypothetical protein